MLEVSEREEVVVALRLPTGSLKTHSGLELVPRSEHSTHQPISQCRITAPSGLVFVLCLDLLHI